MSKRESYILYTRENFQPMASFHNLIFISHSWSLYCNTYSATMHAKWLAEFLNILGEYTQLRSYSYTNQNCKFVMLFCKQLLYVVLVYVSVFVYVCMFVHVCV